MAITPEQILRLPSFTCDLAIDTGVPWQAGTLLAKKDPVLVGTTTPCRPSTSLRLCIFARQAAQARPGQDDLWHIAAIDRPACFLVADLHQVEGHTQCTLIELSARQLAEGAPDILPQTRLQIRRDFEDSLARPEHRFARDTIYTRVVASGTERLQDRFEAVDARSAAELAYDAPDAIPVASATLVKMGFATDTGNSAGSAPEPTPSDPLAPGERPGGQAPSMASAAEADGQSRAEAPKAHARQADDQVEAGTPQAGILAQPTEAAQAVEEHAKDADGGDGLSDESWIVALAESILSESAAEAYLAAEQERVQEAPDSSREQPVAEAAAQALYATMHTHEDEAPRTDTTEGAAPLEMAESAATALYETLHLGEARLAELPDFTCMPAPNGLEFLQADNRALAAHPSLEHAEAQRNFERLLQQHLDTRLLDRLYRGDPSPTPAHERFAEARRLWFDPLSGCEFAPILSADADSYLETLRKAYARQLPEQADGAKPSPAAEEVTRQLALVAGALEGDLQATAMLIDQEVRGVQLPYRYQFSVSFDLSQRKALVNLFLPQKALFPLAVQAGGVGDFHSASGFNRRYQNTACALGVMTLALVKMHAAWVTDLALNAWYRTESEPNCVFTLRTDERTLAELCTNDTEMAFAALKNMKARIHSGNNHELLPLDPVFPLHDGLDMTFGFKSFSNGWTFPPVFHAITAQPSAKNLDATVNMVSDMLARGLTTQAYRTARAHEQNYRTQWLDTLAPGEVALSCDNELEEQLCLRLVERPEDVRILPRRLGQLYHILGAIAANLGVVEQARNYLQQAIGLNPASTLSLLELANTEAADGNAEAARQLVLRAREVAYSPFSLAQSLKQLAWWAAHDGSYDAAYYLYCYSLALYDSESHKEVCHERIAACLSTYLQHTGTPLRSQAQPAIATIDECVAWLKEHDWEIGIGKTCWKLVQAPVEAALDGGPLPDAAYVDAYMTGLHACAGDLEAVRSLILNVYDVRFGNFPFSDYLHKPIMLVDSDIVYTIDAHLGLAPAEANREACLLAIPYIDPHLGLMLQVLGSIDKHTHETVCALPPSRPLKLPARPYRDTAFLLLRPGDFPGFDIAAQAEKLASDYAVGQARDATRGRRDIDLLRDFGNPDDILVLLMRTGVRPEGVWGRLEALDSKGTLYARIENEPFDDFGVHAGDVCELVLDADPESGLALAYAGKVVG